MGIINLILPLYHPPFLHLIVASRVSFSLFLESTAFLHPSPQTVVAQMATALAIMNPQLIVLNQPTPIASIAGRHTALAAAANTYRII